MPGSPAAPTLEMLTRGRDGTGAIPPAFVTRAAAGLFPSAGTRREDLALGDPRLQSPKPWDMDVLPRSCQASLGAFMPHRSVGMAKPGAAQLLEAEEPCCPGCNGVPSLVMLEEQTRLPATGTILPQHQLRRSAPSESAGTKPEADAELPQSRAGMQGSSLMCHPPPRHLSPS